MLWLVLRDEDDGPSHLEGYVVLYVDGDILLPDSIHTGKWWCWMCLLALK